MQRRPTEVHSRQCEVTQVLQLLELLQQHSVTHAAGQDHMLQSCTHVQAHNGHRLSDACSIMQQENRDADAAAQHQ